MGQNLKFFWGLACENLGGTVEETIKIFGVEEVEGKLTRFIEESSRGERGRGAFLG